MEAEVGTGEALHARFKEARASGSAREVRAAAVAYYRARAAQGATQPAAAGELGLTRWTLAKWHQQHDGGRRGGGEQQKPSAAALAECEALRREVEGLGPRGPSRRFPDELKRRLAQWARRELERGVGAVEVAKQVGVPWESISRWLGRRPAPRGAGPKLRPVRVVGGAPGEVASGQRGPVLKSPGGFTVEGLDVPTLVEVLRRLG